MIHSNDPMRLGSVVFTALVSEYLHRYAFAEQDVNTWDMRQKFVDLLTSHQRRDPVSPDALDFVERYLDNLKRNLDLIQEKGLDHWYGTSDS